MSTTSAPSNGEGFHVVVAEDGSLPASELARLGLRPGAPLRVVPEPEPAQERVSAFGNLGGVLSPEAAEALSAGIEAGKADRIETLELS